MRLRQAHDDRDGPHAPGTCGACDRAREETEMDGAKELRLDLDYLATTYNIDLTYADVERTKDGRFVLVLEGTRR